MRSPSGPLKRLFVPSSKNYRNKFSVFLICVAISFFMWGLIKLSRVYEAPLKYRVNYINLPSDKILVKAQDTVLTLFVKARGLELYARMFNPSRNVVNIDLEGMKLRSVGKSYTGNVRSQRYLKAISSQLPPDNVLIGVEPDTLRFIFETEYHKKIPVQADLSLSFASQYQLYDSIAVMPDSVTLFGINSIIDTIYKIRTESKTLKNLKESRLLSLRLVKPVTEPRIKLSADTVNVKITVERFTEANVDVQIETEPEGKSVIRTFPDKVTLTCRVAMREYDRLDPSLFDVTIDYRQATASGNNLAEVKVIRQPDFARVIRIEPPRVEFLLLK